MYHVMLSFALGAVVDIIGQYVLSEKHQYSVYVSGRYVYQEHSHLSAILR